MKFNRKDIINFLFPELQIIETIKREGFIIKKKKHSNYESSKVNVNTNRYENIKEDFNTSYADSNSDLYKDTYSYEKSNNDKRSNRISEVFDNLREELSMKIIGQSNFLDDLVLSFKRPYITGSNKMKPKNIMLLLGSKSVGKHSAIEHIVESLNRKRILNSSKVSKMDLSLYTSKEKLSIFLTDLYKALCSPSNIVVFDNFDKCNSSIIDILENLSINGKYILESRYILQGGNLVEASGMLLQDSVSEISSNGKFFVFTSEKDKVDIFTERFMLVVGDIIRTESFTNAELMELAYRVMENIKLQALNNLLLNIINDEGLIYYLVENYNNSTGVKGMEDFAQAKIYKPLAEFELRNNFDKNEEILLSYKEGQVFAKVDDILINLSELNLDKNIYGIEEVKKELNNIVGIKSVKDYVLSIEDNLKAQRIRENAGLKASNISMHMIFTGNPGTGKTTIARIVAKYLKALGVLSSGQLREVTRADLVGQYIGHTAKITNDVIKSALGGVLFIDEAYSLCRDKNDTFGLEAIDALVKGIEDNRNDLVVILAGYKDEMEGFLKTNTGLKSRFPNIIDFEDYSAEEMYKISIITAKAKGFKIEENCKEPLISLYERKNIKGRNDSGNGRLVRNVIEEAILNQSKRLIKDSSTQVDLLTFEDFNFDKECKFDLEKSLEEIIGLDSVKDFVRTQSKLLIAQEKRKKAGLVVDTSQTLNMIFTGNPGTGKTTVARVVANMFKDMGLLKCGHLVETDRGGLVAEYAGQTSKKTEEVFKSALGGVLFIDEAYALTDSGFDKEAIDTLVKLIEDYRGEILVILAGYKKEMSDFLKINSGLQSRFPLSIDFPDYSAKELYKISLSMIEKKGFNICEDAYETLYEEVTLLHKTSNAYSGNGRMIRNFVEEIMRNQSTRIATNDVDIDNMNLILKNDIRNNKEDVSKSFDLEKELSKIVGLEEVKDYLRSLNARLIMQKQRKKLGLIVDDIQTLHMIFKGNPGTGKTMVARTVADILYNMGIIKTNKLVETDRAGLVAGYVGQTAIKTTDVIMEAMDGVLFIDEAYSLSQGGANDFGKEAIDTLVKLMDDYRDRIVVILAGYSEDMNNFLAVNAGLKSRFPNSITFEDYNTNELLEISNKLFSSKGYEIKSNAKVKLKNIFDEVRNDSQFGNGRYVRNIFEKAVNNQAMRLSTEGKFTKEDLITIIDSDIERV